MFDGLCGKVYMYVQISLLLVTAGEWCVLLDTRRSGVTLKKTIFVDVHVAAVFV